MGKLFGEMFKVLSPGVNFKNKFWHLKLYFFAKQFISINNKYIVSWTRIFLFTIALTSMFSMLLLVLSVTPLPMREGLGTGP